MSKVRVYEVAKQLNMDQKTLVGLFQSMGIGDVRNHMSAVEPELVERVKRQIERQKSPGGNVEERIRPTVVKRRRAEGEGPVSGPVSTAAMSSPAPSTSGSPSSGYSAPLSSPGKAPHGMPSAPRSSPAQSSPGVSPMSARAPASAPSASHVAPAPPSAASTVAAKGSTPAATAAPASAPTARASSTGAAHPASTHPAETAAAAAPVAAAPTAASPSAAPDEAAPAASRRSSKAGADAPASRTGATSARAPMGDIDFDDAPAASTHGAAENAATKSAPATEARDAIPAAPKSAARAVAPASRPGKGKASETGARPPEAAAAPPPAAPVAAAPAARPPAPAAVAAPPVVEAPRRPSVPPRTGIDVWQGRPGVPMPQQPRTAPPPARRTTYDPRAGAAPGRPMMGGGPPYGGGLRGGFPPGRGPNRPGFRRGPHVPAAPRVRIPGTEMSEHKKVIKIEESVSLQKLAGMMSLKVTDVLMRLLSMGMTGVNINSTLDADTAKILSSEFGWTVEDVAVTEEAALQTAMGLVQDTDVALRQSRPPIVTVMGHVDHGKTSLLDKIRKATVAAGEAGGITQHIGAYRVETARGTIAFLDTPGHEAFTAMRARGAQVTDIVILVVAADDGVMPQTKEALAHAQSAKVPILVAVNKIDKPNADPERVKRELAALGLSPEEWGGDTQFVPVSALTGEGVEALLDAVALQAEVMELRADPARRASGVVVEALLDRGRGPVARVMIQDGTLKVGDTLIAGPAWGKVRAMTDEFGRSLLKAGPSTPCEVLGLGDVPQAGDPVHAVKDAQQAEEIAEQRRTKASKSLIPQDVRVSLDALQARLSEGNLHELKLIVKGDVQGSVEAVAASLMKLTTPKVKVTIVHAGVGAITEGDVNLAVASKAIVVGFNVRPAGKAAALAETGGVEIRTYNIIYNAVDDIKSAMEGLLPATKIEKPLGKAEVRKVFNITKTGVVAGCMVVEGVIRRSAQVRLVRNGGVQWTGKINALKRIKEDVKEVTEGFECGISLEEYEVIKEGDFIECFDVEEHKTKLEDA